MRSLRGGGTQAGAEMTREEVHKYPSPEALHSEQDRKETGRKNLSGRRPEDMRGSTTPESRSSVIEAILDGD